MSDILPKIKAYVFIGLIHLVINIGVVLYDIINTNAIDFSQILISSTTLGGAFIPFIDLISLSFINMPSVISFMVGIFTGILSGLQAILIAMMILQVIHNIVWNPDV